MKLFILRESTDSSEDFRDDIGILRALFTRPKLYLLGEIDAWEVVNTHNLDGLVKTPDGVKSILDGAGTK